ncbi:TrmB family transcriptional regulator [Patescibacteria group bacterium]
MIEDVLKQIGLKDKEIQIYLALLPLGSAPASILGKHTNIKRSMAQYTCHQLEQKGLIKSIFKKNTYYYTPESPDKLEYLLDNKVKKINETKEELSRIGADLRSMINPHTTLPKVRFYEGVDGLINLFNDESFLNDDEVTYGVYRYYEDAPKELLDYLHDEYDFKKKKSKNKSFIIRNDLPGSIRRSKADKELHRTSLFISTNEFPFESSFQIYKNKIAFYSYQKSDMTGVLIENEHMRISLYSLFRMAWNYARTLKINEKYKNMEIK